MLWVQTGLGISSPPSHHLLIIVFVIIVDSPFTCMTRQIKTVEHESYVYGACITAIGYDGPATGPRRRDGPTIVVNHFSLTIRPSYNTFERRN